ncbi:MAG: FecCD family ABC transporter permease [Dehalococcoidia bacterium]
MLGARAQHPDDPAIAAARGASPRVPRLRGLGLIGAALLALAAVALVAVTQGTTAIPLGATLGMLLDRLPFVSVPVDVPEAWQRIVFDVRLPRVAAAGLVGAALAYSGAAYQGVFRNPLADPFLLGVASGAALGASIAIVSPLPIDSYGFGWVPLFAFGGACLAVTLVYGLSRTGGLASNATLVLAGVAISAVASGITSFMLLTGGPKTFPIFSFLFGGFNTAAWPRLLAALPYFLVGAAVVLVHARALNVLQLDEEQAAHLGVDVPRTKIIVLAAASVIAAAAVAVAGVIGFVGLIVPHAVRMVAGNDYRRLLPLTAILGATFVIAIDLVARRALAPQEVPVGIVTQILGAPFLQYLLRRGRGGWL